MNNVWCNGFWDDMLRTGDGVFFKIRCLTSLFDVFIQE